MSWYWIALGATAPTIVALLVAWPIWHTRHAVIGSTIGSGVIFIAVIALMGREIVEIVRFNQWCLETDAVCHQSVTAFTRLAAYVLAGFFDVCVVFVIGLVVEERRRRRLLAPEWR